MYPVSKSYPRTRSTVSATHLCTTWITPLLTLLLLILALLPRVIGLNDFFTIDEGYHWMGRVQAFRAALLSGNWAATDIVGHPGVMTMWIGSIGEWMALKHGLSTSDQTAYTVGYLALLRLPVAFVNGLCVMIGYLLLRRRLGPFTALVAGMFWATSPFLIGFSRVLHVDALQTSFATLSVLVLLTTGTPRVEAPNAHHQIGTRSWWAIAASGALMGLALLTKSSSLVLFPWVMILLLTSDWRATIAAVRQSPVRGLLLWLRAPLLWLAVVALVFVACWPAMWVTPIHTIGDVISEVIENGGQAHESGNFFLGQPTEDPGALFYPVVVLWRSSPLTFIGLALLPLVLLRKREERRMAIWLLTLALWFGFVISFSPKKFDRYLLPAWPALEIVAAIGIVALMRLGVALLRRRWHKTTFNRPVAFALSGLIFAGGLLGQDAIYHPYYLGYFNPLLGGGAPGQQVLLTGWGEGFDQVGEWLHDRPDIHKGWVLAEQSLMLQPFLPGVGVHEIQRKFFASRDPMANYAVLYVRGVSREHSEQLEALIRQTVPLHTVRINGVTYAEIYQVPRPFETPIEAVFGDGVRLRGFSASFKRGKLTVEPSWSIERDQPGGWYNFVHVLDAQNQVVAQIDAPVDEGAFPDWVVGQQFGDSYTLPLPKDLPSGDYRLVIGVYKPSNGERLSLHKATPLPAEISGPDALLLTTVTVPPTK